MLTSDLYFQIETLRKELNSYADLETCLTNPQVVELSCRLDELISRAQYLKNMKRKVLCSRRFTNRQWILRRYTVWSGRQSRPQYVPSRARI